MNEAREGRCAEALDDQFACCFIEDAPRLADVVRRQARHEASSSNEDQRTLTLFIYRRRNPHARLATWGHTRLSQRLGTVIVKLGRFHQYRSYSRSLEYMKDVVSIEIGLSSAAQASRVVSIHQVDVGDFEQIVLLWPDANGMGWSDIERELFKKMRDCACVYVLNGRRRFFELSKSRWRAFQIRRALEASFLSEVCVFVVFLVTAPVLALWDGINELRWRRP